VKSPTSAQPPTQQQLETDHRLMLEALAEADAAAAAGEVPVGAILVGPDGQILARSGNRKETYFDPTGHAEVRVLREAAGQLGRWRLTDCTLYVTLEPCVMCAGALVQARIGRVVFGALDPKAGAVASLYKILEDSRLNHRPEVRGEVLAAECGARLTSFFATRRGSARS